MANPLLAASARMSASSEWTSSGGGVVGFSGAQSGRLFADWSPFNQSPTNELKGAIKILRERARQLVRDNSHAAGFVRELANNVIGPNGILLQARITLADQKTPAKPTNSAIERAWKEWGMPEHCSADGVEDWAEFQRTVIKTIATDGEVFIRRLRYFDNPFGYALQIIDAELVDESYNRAPDEQGNEIRLGVEVNRFGRAIAYHVWNRHAGDGGTRQRFRIPASEILHRFVRYRANQVRGVTWFAPVLVNLHYLDGYEFSELQAARVAAAKMGFIVNKNVEAVAGWTPPKDGAKPRTMNVAPGLISELMPGQEFQSFDPKNPSTAFKDFTKAILRGIATGMGMAYTTLTGDLEAVNYSSIRAGLLSERDHWRALQRWMGIHIHRVVYREWVELALLSGALRVDSRLAADYYAVEWHPRGWKWVDPVNDLTAAALAIALGLQSRTTLAAEAGNDFEETVDQIAAEIEYAESMGVDVSGAGQAPTTQERPERRDTEGTTSGTRDDERTDAGDENAFVRRRQITALKLALSLLERQAA